MDTNSIKRLTSIDLMKCIAIFSVLSYHMNYYSYDILTGDWRDYSAYFFRTILSTCVPIFFFVNGFLLFRKGFQLKKHIRKVIHLLIITELWNVFSVLITMCMEKEFMSIKEILKYLYFGGWWTSHLWYMRALISIYIFFPLLKEVYEHNKKIFVFFVITCVILTIGNVFLNEMATIANHVLGNTPKVFGENWFKEYNPLRAIPGHTMAYFCAGGLANLALPRIKKIPVAKRNACAILIMIINCSLLGLTGIFYSNIEKHIWNNVWYGYDTIFTFVNVICIFVLSLNWKKDVYIIRSISQNTLGIYYIHRFFISLFELFIENCNGLNKGGLLLNLLYSLFILCLCWVTCIILRKIPAIKNLVQ